MPMAGAFSRNLVVNATAVLSEARLSLQFCRGWRSLDGTSGQSLGIDNRKTRSVSNLERVAKPLRAALISARVWEREIRSPTPYCPPIHPLFTTHPPHPRSPILLPSLPP